MNCVHFSVCRGKLQLQRFVHLMLWRLHVSKIQALGHCSQLRSQREKVVKIIDANRASKKQC